jgi:hypothetical protein
MFDRTTINNGVLELFNNGLVNSITLPNVSPVSNNLQDTLAMNPGLTYEIFNGRFVLA